MTQHQLIIEYVKEFGSILPAKMSGKVYKGQMFGNEAIRRAQELVEKGELIYGPKDGRFVTFRLKPRITLPPAFLPRKAIPASLFS